MSRAPSAAERDLAARERARERKAAERAARRDLADELRSLFDAPTFFDRAACKTKPTQLFYGPFLIGRGHQETPDARRRREDHAKAICAQCPVIAECRNHARYHREQGVWGGETETERARAGFYDPLSSTAAKAAVQARRRARRERRESSNA